LVSLVHLVHLVRCPKKRDKPDQRNKPNKPNRPDRPFSALLIHLNPGPDNSEPRTHNSEQLPPSRQSR
jgi:cell division protein FtsN